MRTFSILFVFFNFTLTAQTTIIKSSIDSGGNSISYADYKLIYTIGEIAIQESNEATFHFSEGFITPELLKSLTIEDYTQLFGVSFYPNPATDWVTIQFPEDSNIEVQAYDLNGKSVEIPKIEIMEENPNEVTLQLAHLSSAVYAIVVMDHQNKKYKHLKLIKN
jgi:hypothetical protein